MQANKRVCLLKCAGCGIEQTEKVSLARVNSLATNALWKEDVFGSGAWDSPSVPTTRAVSGVGVHAAMLASPCGRDTSVVHTRCRTVGGEASSVARNRVASGDPTTVSIASGHISVLDRICARSATKRPWYSGVACAYRLSSRCAKQKPASCCSSVSSLVSSSFANAVMLSGPLCATMVSTPAQKSLVSLSLS